MRPSGERAAAALNAALTVDDGPPRGDVVVWERACEAGTLRDLGRRLAPRRVHVLAAARPSSPLVDALPENVRIEQATTVEEVLDALLVIDEVAAFVDARVETPEAVDAALRCLAFAVAEGGTYSVVTEAADATGAAGLLERACAASEVAALPHQPPQGLGPDGDEVRLALQPRDETTLGDIVVHRFRKRLPHLRKLWHVDPHRVLDRRLGRGTWGAVLESQPAQAFRSRATVHHNRVAERDRYPRELEVPQTNLVRYDLAECWPRQVARVRHAAIPETFRHFTGGHLHNVFLHWASREYGRRPGGSAVETLEGEYFFLVSEFPHHFGHVITEVLSRLWGWWRLKEQRPDLKALVGVERGGTAPRSFVRTLLNAAGIDDDDIVPCGQPFVVEHLYAATPQFANPRFAHPELGATWSRVGEALRELADPPHTPYADRIFVGRPADLKRRCHNADAVEEEFRARGFATLRPETMPMAQQASAFWHASVVAGYGGSAMCNAVFSRPGAKIIINSAAYTAANEYLHSSVLGDDLHMVWAAADVEHPPGGWSADAVNAGFTVDLGDRPGVRGLRRVLDDALG